MLKELELLRRITDLMILSGQIRGKLRDILILRLLGLRGYRVFIWLTQCVRIITVIVALRLTSGFRQILLSSKPFIIKSKLLNAQIKSVLLIFLLVLLVLQDAELLAERLDVVDDLGRVEHTCE